MDNVGTRTAVGTRRNAVERHGEPEMVTVETDTRSRVSLKRLGVEEHRQYLAHVEVDGTVVLTPAVVVSEAEARFHANPEVGAQILDNRTHSERLVPRRRRR
ncbi:hypothetical protein BH23ACT10_BH23ACT10_32680 [soil metagenome]